MMESYTFMNKREFDYTWNINNFSYYYDFVYGELVHIIKSTVFDIDGHKDCKFYLRMNICSTHIECYFQLKPCTEFLNLSCQISILDKNNEKFETRKGRYFHDSFYNIDELPNFYVSKEELFEKKLNLIPDNCLRVICNLTLYSENTTTSQILIPKCHQLMKDHFKKLLDSQSGSDIVFKVDDKEFKAHKIIMMARSPVFLAMFNNDMIGNNSNRVKVKAISSSVFELLLEFIYTDEIKIKLDVETGLDLLRAASKYQLEGLEALCETELFNLLTVNNALDVLSIAETHNCTDLVESIKDFIKVHQENI